MNDVQALVDGLAERLQRPVGVDDRRFRSIAYSSHADDIDPVRRESILGRQAPEAVTRWLLDQGVFGARGYLRLPAKPDLGMLARVCVPVRFHQRLLGFLWLIEGDSPFDDEELEISQQYAEELADELYRLERQGDEERREQAEWLAGLLSPTSSNTAKAAAPLSAAAFYAVIVVDVSFARGVPLPPGVDVRLAEAVDRLRRVMAPHHHLAAVSGSSATILLGGSSPQEFKAHAVTLSAAVQAELEDIAGAEPLVGVGDAVTEFSQLPVSETHARLAAHLGRSMPQAGRVVAWDELGVMRLLGGLLDGRDAGEFIPASLRRLLAEPDGELLVKTLESYLEHGGDAAAAASELFIHRSSLYNRLRRIQEVSGIDIRSGADRLEMHLGIRLWRLS